MSSKLVLGRIAGIKVALHWSFFLLLPYLAYSTLAHDASIASFLVMTLFVLLVFFCVLLHEFGHALAARRYGIGTRDITLTPIGGIAQLEGMPEKPAQELVVAVAGPLVNVAIALVLAPIIYLTGDVFAWPGGGLSEQIGIAGYLFYINILLILFNLLPAFPMDGGRILRSLLSMRLKDYTATRIASILGIVIGFGMIVVGMIDNMFLVFIGLFVLVQAFAERRESELVKEFAESVAAEYADDEFHYYGDPPAQLTPDLLDSFSGTRYLLFNRPQANAADDPLILIDLNLWRQQNPQNKRQGGYRFNHFSAPIVAPDQAMDLVFRELRKQRRHFAVVASETAIRGVIDLPDIFREHTQQS